MFELNEKEFENWRCQNGTSNLGQGGNKMGLRYAPYAFTEQGVAMLSSVFAYMKQLLVPVEQAERERIGFRQRGAEN